MKLHPLGATVVVDGSPASDPTPLSLPVHAGMHDLALRLAHHDAIYADAGACRGERAERPSRRSPQRDDVRGRGETTS